MTTFGVAQSIQTDIDWLLSDFYTGKNLYKDLSEKIFNTIFIDLRKEYIHFINRAKEILNNSEREEYQGLYIITTNSNIEELKPEEKVSIIRYVNICHGKKNFIIILNGEIIYVPDEFAISYGLEIVHEDVQRALRILSFKKQLKTKIKTISKKILMK